MTNGNRDPSKTDVPADSNEGDRYEIKIKGLLEDYWEKWFEGMTLQRIENGATLQGFTILSGQITDQAALHGLLAKIRDLNLTLLSVDRIDLAKTDKTDLNGYQSPEEASNENE